MTPVKFCRHSQSLGQGQYLPQGSSGTHSSVTEKSRIPQRNVWSYW